MLRSTLKEHSATFGTLAINLVATIVTCFNPSSLKELYTLYGLSITGLYGYSQQARFSSTREEVTSEIERL